MNTHDGDSSRPDELRRLAERLAIEAADFVRRRRAEVFGTDSAAAGAAVRVKSSPTDPVTVVDTETEQLLRDRLARLRPGDLVLGEEGGGEDGGGEDGGGEDGGGEERGGEEGGGNAGPVQWVLDPIDGTVNFLYGLPAYAVSIGARINGVAVAGAVADVARGEIYSAALGGGARVLADGRHRPLRCSAATDLALALVGTGFSYDSSKRSRQAELLAMLLPRVRDVRRMGAAALDLCMVADGRLDVFYEEGLKVWDWAAGALIAAEAGAVVTIPDTDGALLVAAAPGVAAPFAAAMRDCCGS